ncbi:MAG: DUF1552 domain-containing protein, partial [Myxococcales bacterium]|nr:DUF1552 domain-containing protein [Myxococcales bacterium]
MARKIPRRLVLRGAGGAVLALPWLPSLTPRGQAQPSANRPRRFIAMRTEHGGIRGANTYPTDGMLTETLPYAGYGVRRGDLVVSSNGGTASVSPMLSAPNGVFTPALAAKMNVLRGLDIPFYISHHRGGTLGNYGDTDTAGDWPLHPTCDQVLAWSNKFYGDLSTNLLRSMVIGEARMSWGYSNPQNPGSSIQAMQHTYQSLPLFDQIFRPPSEPTMRREPIINRVYEDYKRLHDGHRRLSSEDKRRLSDHMSRIDEIERKLTVTVSCGDVERPTANSYDMMSGSNFNTFARDPAKHTDFWKLINDVVVAAMTCDTSRIATMRLGSLWHNNSEAAWFSESSADWHQDIAHRAFEPSAQSTLLASKRRIFEHVFLDLISKLDAVAEPYGGTLLDSCCVFWTDESGPQTHDP